MSRVRILAALLAEALVVGGCGGDATFGVDAPAAERIADYLYEIPAGSGARIDAGEPLEILPASLDAKIGEIIEIVNDDDRGHLVGPFYVGAHETIRHEFSSAGEFAGECSVHPSGQIVIRVS